MLPTTVARAAPLAADITGGGLRAAHLSSVDASFKTMLAHAHQHRWAQLDLKAFQSSDDSDRDHLAALPRRLLVEQVELPGDEWVVLQVLNCAADDVVDVRVDRDLVERRRRDKDPLIGPRQSNEQLQVAAVPDIEIDAGGFDRERAFEWDAQVGFFTTWASPPGASCSGKSSSSTGSP